VLDLHRVERAAVGVDANEEALLGLNSINTRLLREFLFEI
jgi:hypothetical protein